MEKTYKPEDLAPSSLNLTVRSHIVRDLKEMERNTKMSVDELATKALLMFIATHNDFLGLRK